MDIYAPISGAFLADFAGYSRTIGAYSSTTAAYSFKHSFRHSQKCPIPSFPRATQDNLRPHFGLGNATNAELLKVDWPSGVVQEMANVPTNQILTVIKPGQLKAVNRPASGNYQMELFRWLGTLYDAVISSNPLGQPSVYRPSAGGVAVGPHDLIPQCRRVIAPRPPGRTGMAYCSKTKMGPRGLRRGDMESPGFQGFWMALPQGLKEIRPMQLWPLL